MTDCPSGSGAAKRPPTILDIINAKNVRKLVMLTAYDAPGARIAEAGGADLILVGDSAAMTVLGRPDTNSISMDEMLHHARAVTAAARICHEAGVKVLLNDSPFTPSLPAELVAASDILLVNEHEMAQLLGIDEPEDDDWGTFDWGHVLDEMRSFGFDQAIVTLGGDGSVVLDTTAEEPIQRIAPVRVKAVDTTCCGDSFMGTVLAGLASGMSLSESAQLAAYVSAYAATGYGAQASYGNAAQIREAFAE